MPTEKRELPPNFIRKELKKKTNLEKNPVKNRE